MTSHQVANKRHNALLSFSVDKGQIELQTQVCPGSSNFSDLKILI